MCFNSFNQYAIVLRLPDPENLHLEESGHQPETLRRAAPQHDGSRLLTGRVRMHLWLDVDG